MARLRTAPALQNPPATAEPPKTRQVLKEKTNTTRTKAPVYENDGNTEDLIKDARPRPRRGRPRKAAVAADEVVMTGGFGLAGSDGKNSDSNAAPPTTDELAKSDETSAPAPRANRRAGRTTRKIVQSEEQRDVMEGVKRRMQATSRKENIAPHQESGGTAPSLASVPPRPSSRKAGSSAMERSVISTTPSPPPQSKLNTGTKQQRQSLTRPGSALRSHGTPAVESSILALKNFKRRPRQPSMLQMVQQRTTSARPSAVHNADSEWSACDASDAGDDVEDFQPEAEGTPLNAATKDHPTEVSSKRASKTLAAPAVKNTSAAKKRKSDDVDRSSTSALEALRSKRRRSPAGDLHEDPLLSFQESASVPPRSSQGLRESPVRLMAEVQVVNSQSSPTPPTELPSKRRSIVQDEDVAVPSTEKAEAIDRVDAPDIDETDIDEADLDVHDTMADPLSSSPPLPVSPVATRQTDIMADPLTQVTPPRPRRDKSTKQKNKPAAITTADLQSLLPRRRQPLKPRKRKSEYDFNLASDEDEDVPLDSNELEENEDELGGNLRRQTKSSAESKRKAKSTTSKSTARQSKTSHTLKAPTAPPRKSTLPTKTAKTYSRRAPPSDKENDDDDAFSSLSENDDSALPDTSISMYEAAQSKELEAAKKKFDKIDEWDMEFESVSFEGHRSSSQGWR